MAQSFSPQLALVIPMRGKIDETWYRALMRVSGEIEFVFVLPPNAYESQFDDARVRALVSPFRGEVFQRLLGLVNTRAPLLLTMDCDDLPHPEILSVAVDYFERFPASWMLRLVTKNILDQDRAQMLEAWEPLPLPRALSTCPPKTLHAETVLAPVLFELPIAPLDMAFDWRYVLPGHQTRREVNAVHAENFVNRIWRASIVRPVLDDLSRTIGGQRTLKFVPFWALDRLLGLYVQAYHFKCDIQIGHWFLGPPQVRRLHFPLVHRRGRNYFFADSILVRRFSQYGYLWNLFFWSFHLELSRRLHQA